MMQKSFVFLFAFSPFLNGFRQNSRSWGQREKLEFCPFFKSVKILFSSVSFFCSLLLCFLLKRDKKEEKMWSRKNSVLFFDTSHEREKEEKIHSHYEGRSAF